MKSKRIVITRARHQAGELANLLQAKGAEPLFYPCIAILPPEDTRELDSSLKKANQDYFDWIVFTSANTVYTIANRLKELSLSLSELNNTKIAAIGPATKMAVQDYLKLTVDLMPKEYVAEALVEVLLPAAGEKIFLPQSNLARPILGEMLTTTGAEVIAVSAYFTKIGTGGFDLQAGLVKNEIDTVTFTSSSSVQNFIDRLKNEEIDIALFDGICIACMGPITTETARKAGLLVSVMTTENTIHNLVSQLTEYFNQLELMEKK